MSEVKPIYKPHLQISIHKKVENFFKQFKVAHFKKGQIILTATDPLKEIYYIKKGYVRIFTISSGGDEITLHIAKPGAFFPMMLVLSGRPNKYHYNILKPSILYSAPVGTVLDFIKKDPEILDDLLKRFSAGICGLMERIEDLLTNEALTKVSLLLQYFFLRHGHKTKDGYIIQLPASQSDISTWLGLNRETVSRQIKKLKLKGIITYKGHTLIIKKPKALNFA